MLSASMCSMSYTSMSPATQSICTSVQPRAEPNRWLVSRPKFGKDRFFDFRRRKRYYRDPLSLAQRLQQKLAAIPEANRVPIGVHFGTYLDELHLFHFSNPQL